MSKADAKLLVNQFLARTSVGKFTNISRQKVGKSLLDRIDHPGKINQGLSSLCAPAALLFNVAQSNPVQYATFAISLFEKGKGKIGKLEVEPDSDLKRSTIKSSSIDPADWITLASIRDSSNWFFDYQATQNEAAGVTFPSSLEGWFKKAGYTQVTNETNLLFDKDEANAKKANDLYNKKWKVSLFINANMLSTPTSSSATADHWVVLSSPMTLTTNSVKFTVYTWGQPKRNVPKSGTLSLSDFLDNYYGFVACKF